jgi:hypothetical protein
MTAYRNRSAVPDRDGIAVDVVLDDYYNSVFNYQEDGPHAP